MQLDQYSATSLENEEELSSISFEGSSYSTSFPTIIYKIKLILSKISSILKYDLELKLFQSL